MRRRAWLLWLAGILVLAAGLSVYVAYVVNPTTTTDPGLADVLGATTLPSGRVLETVSCNDAPDEYEILCQAFELIQNRYVDDIPVSDLAAAAASGLADLDGATSRSPLVCVLPAAAFSAACELAADEAEDGAEAAEAMVYGLAEYALDPNSAYLDAESLRFVEEEQGGQIEGIGALVTAEDSSSGTVEQCSTISDTCHLFIVSTVKGGPAETAGIKAEDRLISVDGDRIEGRPIDEITALVRGPAGTDVDITIIRETSELEFKITREAVQIPVVESQVVGNVGYLRLNLFSNTADEQFDEAFDNLLSNDITSLVVDFRGNPGGLLDAAIQITSKFLSSGGVVTTQNPETSTNYEVTGDITIPEAMPVTVLVDRGSASASEVVAAVLQERGRALVVGEPTFGKNTVQQRFPLANDGAIKLTVARWVTPGGLDFGTVGLEPDVLLELGPDLTVEELIAAVANLS